MGNPAHSFIVLIEKKVFLPFLSSFPFPSDCLCFSLCLLCLILLPFPPQWVPAGTWSGSLAHQKLSLLPRQARQARQAQLPVSLLAGQVLQFSTIMLALIHAYESLPGPGDKKLFPLFSTPLPPDDTNTQEIEISSSEPSSLCEVSFQATSLCFLKAPRYLVRQDGKGVLCRDTCPIQLGMEVGLSHCSKFLSQSEVFFFRTFLF